MTCTYCPNPAGIRLDYTHQPPTHYCLACWESLFTSLTPTLNLDGRDTLEGTTKPPNT